MLIDGTWSWKETGRDVSDEIKHGMAFPAIG